MFHQNFGGGFGNDDMGPGRIGFSRINIFKIIFVFEFWPKFRIFPFLEILGEIKIVH